MKKGLAVIILFSLLNGVGSAALACGFGTFWDADVKTCLCDSGRMKSTGDKKRKMQVQSPQVHLAGIFDEENYYWGEWLFNFTVSLINDHNDGWHDDLFVDGTNLDYTVADSACDETEAARSYWKVRTHWGTVDERSGPNLHGVVGSRCSGASVAVANIAGLEGVPQVSPSATDSQLSNKEEFPYFSRVVAPGDSRGEIGALVSLLRLFGWDRVGILATDTAFAKGSSTEFQRLWVGKHNENNEQQAWEGKVAFSYTVTLNRDDSVDSESLRQALDGVPTNDPTVNSRVILLFAHHQHAYAILQTATKTDFQPDTIWVGTSSWVGRLPPDKDRSWYPAIPGWLGVSPYRNRDASYVDFLERVQTAQRAEGRRDSSSLPEKMKVWKDLPDYAAEYMVDSILALSKALAPLPPNARRNGTHVMNNLLGLNFSGVSGEVSFTETGDRKNPMYSIYNLQLREGVSQWHDLGSTGTSIGSASLYRPGISAVCFASVGCGLEAPPSATYPVKRQIWFLIVVPLILVILVGVGFCYWRTHRKNVYLRSSVSAMQKTMEDMKKIDSELDDIDQQVEHAKKRQKSLILKRALLKEKPDTWSESDQTLVEVKPNEEQYWTVLDRLQETMTDAHISKIWRVQNASLWAYFSFHKDRLAMTGIDSNERSVWHGTSSLDPKVIYEDKQDGFMMQFSRDGFWGRGIYFAEKSAYSHSYSFKPSTGPSSSSGAWCKPSVSSRSDERPPGAEGEREMFMARLLVGNEKLMDRDTSPQMASKCHALTVPPTDPRTNLKYNTVTGYTGGSQVWIVYENGRAYPDYLVRYYRGKRDPKRSPFASRVEAMKKKTESAADLETGTLDSSAKSGVVAWEYQDDFGWKPYASVHQDAIESAYQLGSSKVQIRTKEWTYEVNMELLVQTNIEHADRKKRKVRRLTN